MNVSVSSHTFTVHCHLSAVKTELKSHTETKGSSSNERRQERVQTTCEDV